MIPQVQIPDFVGTLRGAEQAQTSRLQALAMQQELADSQAVNAVLREAGPQLLSGDASALGRLAGAGSRGLAAAMPFHQMNMQRVRPAGEGEIPGLRPGTVAMVNGLGVPQILQQPDTMSPEAMQQRLRLAGAGRAPTVTWRDERDESGALIGQRSSTGQFNPINTPGLSPAAAQALLPRFAPGYAAGTLTPEQERLFESALSIAAAPRTQFDPATGQAITIRPELPSYVVEAVQARRGGQGGAQPAAGTQAPTVTTPAPAPAATPEAAAPAQAGGVAVAQVMPARQSAPAGFRWAQEGRLEAIPGGPQDPAIQPLTEAQGRSNLFGQQMQMGDEIIRRVQVPSLAAQVAWRNAPEGAVNFGLNENDQQYFNALRIFAAGILRKETGAAFTAQELLDVQSRFFPLPGDTPAVMDQKARARQAALGAIQAEIPGGMRGAVGIPGTGMSAEPPRQIPPPPRGFVEVGR